MEGSISELKGQLYYCDCGTCIELFVSIINYGYSTLHKTTTVLVSFHTERIFMKLERWN